jgi:hypothetical protein
MNNMIIECNRDDPQAADMNSESQGPLVEVDHEVSAELSAFIGM